MFIGQVSDQKIFLTDIDQSNLIQLKKVMQEINSTRKIDDVYEPFAEISDLFFDLLASKKLKN